MFSEKIEPHGHATQRSKFTFRAFIRVALIPANGYDMLVESQWSHQTHFRIV